MSGSDGGAGHPSDFLGEFADYFIFLGRSAMYIVEHKQSLEVSMKK